MTLLIELKIKVVMIKERDESGSGDSPPITSIKTRVINNSPYNTIIVTLVLLLTIKQQPYAKSNKSINISSAILSLSY